MVNEPDQLAQRGLPAQVNRTLDPGMMIANGPNLHELHPAAKVIDHLLIPGWTPPLAGDVVLAPGGNDPKWEVAIGDFVDLGIPGFLAIGQMDVAAE